MTFVHPLTNASTHTFDVSVSTHDATLRGDLTVPPGAEGLVIFAHGSGSSRLSPRNRRVADMLNRARFATLLFDLLTPEEEALDAVAGDYRFDIVLLAQRLAEATDWAEAQPDVRGLPIGYFGASTGAAAALVAAAGRGDRIAAIVSRGGRPDLAGKHLPNVTSPTLLIVGERDRVVLDLNARAERAIGGRVSMYVVPHATHLFEEPGAMDQVASLAEAWFARYFAPSRRAL